MDFSQIFAIVVKYCENINDVRDLQGKLLLDGTADNLSEKRHGVSTRDRQHGREPLVS